MTHTGDVTMRRRGRTQPRLFLLMAFLFLGFALYPVLCEARILGAHLFALLSVFVLAAVVRSVAASRTQRVVMTVLAILVLGLQYADSALLPEVFELVGVALYSAMLAYAAAAILKYVFNDEPVTTNKIYGAVSVYLLLGYIWALVYVMLELAMPGSFHLPDTFAESGALPYLADDRMAMFFYYSFVTLTTLGYGDILPARALASTLAASEAMMGQLFVAVLLARLVALQIVHAGRDDRHADD